MIGYIDRRRLSVVTLVGLFGMLAPMCAGQITALSSSGSGGTVGTLSISSIFNTDDTAFYAADFTASAPITIGVTVASAGDYYLSTGNLTNSTGMTWPTFDISLVGAPGGSTLDEFGWDNNVFAGGTLTPPFPNATNVEFSGSAGLPSGGTTGLNVGAIISAAGTFDFVLRPPAVPEPANIALCVAMTGLILGRRARRRLA